MNLRQRRSRWSGLLAASAIGALLLAAAAGPASAQGGKGYDTEFGFTFGPVKAKGLQAPAYAQGEGGKAVVSDMSAGGIFTVPLGGGAASQSAKLKRPGGLAVAPASFGSYAGQTFALSPEGGDEKGACVVNRIDKSGSPSVFAKLPNAGGQDGGKPTGCRDLEFGPDGMPFAGKLYAVTSGNAAIYEIDSGAKARAFGVFEKPLAWELNNIGFTSAGDSKAPNAMLASVRPKTETASRVGRIAIIGPDGKMADNPYLVGFIRPTGFGFAPDGFGNYAGVLFIADAGKWASENSGEHDGRVYRLFKGVAREYATGMVDPTCLKFVGKTMVLCDPAAHGKTGAGALLAIAPGY